MSSTPTGRRLEALAVLQAQPGITAERLAARLGTTERTARRDVAHLRELGYRIDAEPGRYGGYTLAAGTTMPPLLLDADEALAVVVGLRTSTGLEGLGPAAATALAKLTTIVPSRLRARMRALGDLDEPTRDSPASAAPEVLLALALACRAGEAVRLRHHRPGAPAPRVRELQPSRLVRLVGNWYLVACERDGEEWRTWRVDRIGDVRALGTRFDVPPAPDDPVAFAQRSLATGRRHRVRLRVQDAAAEVRARVDPSVAEVGDDPGHAGTCLVTLATDNLDGAARWIVLAGLDAEVLEPDALRVSLHELGRRLVERHGRDG